MYKKKLIKESVGVSFEVREWANIIYYLLNNLGGDEPRLIVDGQDYPKQYKKFSVDYFVIDFNDWTNGYLDKTSGYDKDDNYVVHIMVLNKFRNHEYMRTILNHELKHAYQDWQRQRKGYPKITYSKESQELYTDDFIRAVKDKVDVGAFFKEILKGYYLLSDLELNAFMENVYDRDTLNDYRKMIKRLKNINLIEELQTEDETQIEHYWSTLKSLDIPFIKKYKDYYSFLDASTKYFRRRTDEVLHKINKLEYVHRNRE